MNAYEQRCQKKLDAWRSEAPGWGSRVLSKPTGAAGRALQKVVPDDAIHSLLKGLNGLAHKLSSESSLLRRAGVDDISALREASLEHCDRLARSERRRSMAMGAAGGAAFGVVGAAGLVADVPAVLALALRTIQRTGLCYGERAERDLIIGVYALASASTREEKAALLDALDTQPADAQRHVRDTVQKAAERQFAKEAAVFSLQNLAPRIGLQLGQRKAAGGIPIVGAAVGSTVNAWYLRDVSHIAQCVFQGRWLAQKYSR